jgi:hypothetical protein
LLLSISICKLNKENDHHQLNLRQKWRRKLNQTKQNLFKNLHIWVCLMRCQGHWDAASSRFGKKICLIVASIVTIFFWIVLWWRNLRLFSCIRLCSSANKKIEFIFLVSANSCGLFIIFLCMKRKFYHYHEWH